MTWPPTLVDGFHRMDSVRLMEYRKLGGTDMIVSKLGLGGGPFGGLYNAIDQTSVNQIVSDMLKNGVNYIDTAYWYGQGRSEEALGKALQGVPRSSYYIATKVCRYEKEFKEMFDFSGEKALKHIDLALARLGLPYVDVIFAHDVEYCENEDTILHETLPALMKAKQAGKARYIGISAYPLEKLKSIVEKSTVPIDVIITYSRAILTDFSLRHYIPFFKSKNVGIVNAAPLGMGLLTDNGPPDWHLAPENIKAACRAAAGYCKQQNVDIAKLAVHECINFPGVATTVVGFDNPAYVDKNLNASWGYLTMDERRCLNDINRKYFLPLNDANFGEEQMKAYKDSLQEDDSTWT